MSDGQVDVPSPLPSLTPALPPVPEGHVALELDWVIDYDPDDATDPDAPSLSHLLDTQAAEWHVALALVQEVGPGGGNPVVRLSGPPANVALALLHYNGVGQIFDVSTFKWVKQPAFSDALEQFSYVYDFTTGAPVPFFTSAPDASDASDGDNL